MSGLYQYLEEYRDSDFYPFHMPGHKRNKELPLGNVLMQAQGIDITEIDGFDNLHKARGILAQAQREAASIYGAEESFFLVNGSTCGLLSAVCAAAGKRNRILMMRNSHQAVYHAVCIQELYAEYLIPAMIREYGFADAISPEQVEEKLNGKENIAAVVITSPTYEGVTADIAAIADVVHRFDIPLIVDEAHGAHFGFHKGFPENAVRQGADIVVHSVHKTLPAMTQTALLHVQGGRINRDRLRRYLSMYQTSSPSYVLMASLDSCMEYMKKEGEHSLENLLFYRQSLEERTKRCRRLHLISAKEMEKYCMKALDPGKIMISTAKSTLTGKELYDILRISYHLQPEMAAEDYVLMMASMADTQTGFDRLAEAVIQIDAQDVLEEKSVSKLFFPYGEDRNVTGQSVMTIAEALEKENEYIFMGDSCGRIAAEFIKLYPPGIPLIVPGERLDRDQIEYIKLCIALNLNVQGMQNEYIKVVK